MPPSPTSTNLGICIHVLIFSKFKGGGSSPPPPPPPPPNETLARTVIPLFLFHRTCTQSRTLWWCLMERSGCVWSTMPVRIRCYSLQKTTFQTGKAKCASAELYHLPLRAQKLLLGACMCVVCVCVSLL